jgi:hypothetical protein
VATWNVRAITNKADELELELSKGKIDIAKKKNKGSKELRKYITIYSGGTRGKLGIIRRCNIS